jgi:hypothetical protein
LSMGKSFVDLEAYAAKSMSFVYIGGSD